MQEIENYRSSEVCRRQGDNFLIEVKHYTYEYAKTLGEGEHRWNVYAYIYPKHKHFSAFDGTETMYQDAAAMLPLHAGPSFCRIHVDHRTGSICSYQVGSDYNHLYDDYFSRAATPQDAWEVFNDANDLYEWLKARGERDE